MPPVIMSPAIMSPAIMSPAMIFNIQLALGYIPWLLVVGAYVWPALRGMDGAQAQRVIAALHAFRFFGLVFIFTGVTGAPLPAAFAGFAAYGDFATGLLAMLAMTVFRVRALFWFLIVAFNVVGAVDIIGDYYHGVQTGLPEVAGNLGATYSIVMIYVPLLMITHAIAFYLLVRPKARLKVLSAAQRSDKTNPASSS